MSNSQPTILLVDDERRVLSSLTRCLARLGVNLVDYSCPQQALEFAAENRPDLVISDQRMPIMQGSQMLSEIKTIWPDIHTIILSGYSDLESLSDAFNRRIIDRFISKPWDNNELRMVVTAALREQGLFGFSGEKNTSVTTDFHGMHSANPAMYRLFERITKSARANIPIFISGETGTGKELVARACHLESPRKSQPFIAINCANFNENLIESQLFGHMKGAFTGATADHQGLMAAAGQGTLFLDEVTTLPLSLQAKLLRVIQEREFSPVGSHQSYPFVAQLLTASSTTLAKAVELGQFREDLYYRLNVIPLQLPPLRDRGDDVVIMAEYFLRFFARQESKVFNGFSEDAEVFLRQYPWPGNVRQLENLVHSIVVLADQRIVDGAMLGSAIEGGSLLKDAEGSLLRDAEGSYSSLKYAEGSYSSLKDAEGSLLRDAEGSYSSLKDAEGSCSSLKDADGSLLRKAEGSLLRQADGSLLKQANGSLASGSGGVKPLWQVEKNTIEDAIASCGGNIPKAAALLEVSPSTIYRKQKHW